MEPSILNEYRCDCGKLLFKGSLLSCRLEIKCKRCGNVKAFDIIARGTHFFMLMVAGDGCIIDACDGVSVIASGRQQVIGKSFFDVLPIVRDGQDRKTILKPDAYQIRSNPLFLRDRTATLESHIIPTKDGKKSIYRVFNIIRESR